MKLVKARMAVTYTDGPLELLISGEFLTYREKSARVCGMLCCLYRGTGSLDRQYFFFSNILACSGSMSFVLSLPRDLNPSAFFVNEHTG